MASIVGLQLLFYTVWLAGWMMCDVFAVDVAWVGWVEHKTYHCGLLACIARTFTFTYTFSNTPKHTHAAKHLVCVYIINVKPCFFLLVFSFDFGRAEYELPAVATPGEHEKKR